MIITLFPIIGMVQASPLSTTKDGAFQAIAQSSRSIGLYYKGDADHKIVTVNGTPYANIAWSVDSATGYSVSLISDLSSNTRYEFRIDGDETLVSECTWLELPNQCKVDLLVIGGTASGVSAAVTAVKLGLRVAIVEETNRLGGMASNGLGSTDIADMSRANGFFEGFRRRIIAYYGSGDGRFYEPRIANAIFKEMLYENSGILRFQRTEVVKPIVSANCVQGAIVQDCISGATGKIFAKVTIDATVTGDFAAACGAHYRVGREARSTAEPHAGAIYFDNAKQEILPGSTGEADCRQQSYAYLMIWKDYGENLAPQIEKPRFYDPENYRYSPEWTKSWNYSSGRLPGNKFEINQHPFGTDWPGINYDYPNTSPERRREIESMCRDRALGYLYFMQNERGHKNLGLAVDEFVDNSNFPVDLYVREARRVEGKHIFNESDVTGARENKRVDAVAIGDYPMDSHATEDLKDPNRIDRGEGEQWLKSFTQWYQVPLGILIPKNIEGLLVSTAVSATHIGYGTLRMEPVRMSLGQAAAAAAYWSILYSMPLRHVNPAWVQDKILWQGAYINWNSDVTCDTRHFVAINFLTARGMFPGEAFRPDSPITESDALSAIEMLLALEECNEPLDVGISSPDEPINRGLFAKWLVEANRKTLSGWNMAAPGDPTYSDVLPDSPYFAAVETMAAHRIKASLFENTQPGMFMPQAQLIRADAAEAIYLALRQYVMSHRQRSQ